MSSPKTILKKIKIKKEHRTLYSFKNSSLTQQLAQQQKHAISDKGGGGRLNRGVGGGGGGV